MRCFFCGDPAVHPATGVQRTENVLACQRCARELEEWQRKRERGRPRGGTGPSFYEHAYPTHKDDEFKPNARVKAWVKVLMEHRDEIGRAIGMPLGSILGCGHWGCVVDLPDPWALKLTIDPTEAHIWKKIVALINEEGYGGDGFPRVKEIYELDPGVMYGGRKKRTYAIVREKVQPALSWPRGGRAVPTSATLMHLGAPAGVSASMVWEYRREGAMQVVKFDQPIEDERIALRADDFATNMEALAKYRDIARDWFTTSKDWGGIHGPRPPTEALKERLDRAIYRMSGPIGGPVGESLLMLSANDVVLNDVHWGNVGWRQFEEIDDDIAPICLVIFDPGHTPTAKDKIDMKLDWRGY